MLDIRSEIFIGGMTCVGCSSQIQERLKQIEGIDDVVVNFANGRASIVHDSTVSEKDIRRIVEELGYGVSDAHDYYAFETQRAKDIFRRLIFAAVLTISATLLSMSSLIVDFLHFPGWEWLVAGLVTPVVFWSGWRFHASAWLNLRQGIGTMDTLVSLGTLSTWIWSASVLIFELNQQVFFETGAVIITLILLGRWLELRALHRSGNALRLLADLGLKKAMLEDQREVPIGDLQVGMRFIVRPGERIATDGVVADGVSMVNASMVTGESALVEVRPGDEVIGATVNSDGLIIVEATRVGSDTMLAQIERLVAEAQMSTAGIQRLVDLVARVFVPLVVLISLSTLLGWVLVGKDIDAAFAAAVAVLIIACPCALGLATPLAIIVGIGRGAQQGIFIKGAEALEDSREIETVVVDKTGTLTEASMEVVAVTTAKNSNDTVGLSAALMSMSEHPVADAISAVEDKCRFKQVSGLRNIPGMGVTGLVEGKAIRVGRRSLFGSISEDLEFAAVQAEGNGQTVVFAGQSASAEALFVLSNRLRSTSLDAVQALSDLGLRVVMLTGDNAASANRVSEALGIKSVVSGVLPGEKAAVIRDLQRDGSRVAMVGDGINDAPALAQADLGIAMGAGTDVAIEASDLTVVSEDLMAVVDAVELSRATMATIRVNLFWAFAYNVAAIPLAAAGFLSHELAALVMSLSSLFVVSNSLRLRSFKGSCRVLTT